MDHSDEVATIPAGPPQEQKESVPAGRVRRGRPRSARGRRRSQGSSSGAGRWRAVQAIRSAARLRPSLRRLSPFYGAQRAEMLERIYSRRRVRYEENMEESIARSLARYQSQRDAMEYQRQ